MHLGTVPHTLKCNKRSAAVCKDDSFDDMVEGQLVQHVADNVLFLDNVVKHFLVPL